MPSDIEQPVISDFLYAFVNPVGARVLDIGCGRGRRTRQYTEAAGSVIGIDPNGELLAENLAQLSTPQRTRIGFVQARAEALPFPCETFDLALLSWSL